MTSKKLPEISEEFTIVINLTPSFEGVSLRPCSEYWLQMTRFPEYEAYIFPITLVTGSIYILIFSHEVEVP